MVAMRLTVAHVGWFVFWFGLVTDLFYHIPLLFGVQWPLFVDVIGEAGHTVIFVGIVILIFGVLRKHTK
jgi:uncharacterized protein involved in cysteine biosynthesis